MRLGIGQREQETWRKDSDLILHATHDLFTIEFHYYDALVTIMIPFRCMFVTRFFLKRKDRN